MKLSLEILYTSIKDDGLSYGENWTCLATLVFEIHRKQKNGRHMVDQFCYPLYMNEVKFFSR